MDIGRFAVRYTSRWEKIMAKLLEVSFSDVSDKYDPVTFQGIFKDIETALVKKDFPEQIEGKDESRAMNWFMG